MRQRAFQSWQAPTERSNAAEGAVKTRAALDVEMAAFDRLPKAVQAWLDSAPRKFSAVEIERLIKRGTHKFDGFNLVSRSFFDID